MTRQVTYAARINALKGKAEQATARELKGEYESAKSLADGSVPARNKHWKAKAVERKEILDNYLKVWE